MLKSFLFILALGVWIFLTKKIKKLITTLLSFPMIYFKKRSDFSDFSVSVLASLIVLCIGIKLFTLLGLDQFLLGIPITMLFAYYKSLNYTRNEPGATALKYGSYTGVILGIFIFGLI